MYKRPGELIKEAPDGGGWGRFQKVQRGMKGGEGKGRREKRRRGNGKEEKRRKKRKQGVRKKRERKRRGIGEGTRRGSSKDPDCAV